MYKWNPINIVSKKLGSCDEYRMDGREGTQGLLYVLRRLVASGFLSIV